METNELVGQGYCGLEVTLNLMDQYAVTHLVNRIDQYYEAKAKHDEWSKLCAKERPWKSDSREEALAWDSAHPEPERVELNLEEEMEMALKFLRKLTLSSSCKATIFD